MPGAGGSQDCYDMTYIDKMYIAPQDTNAAEESHNSRHHVPPDIAVVLEDEQKAVMDAVDNTNAASLYVHPIFVVGIGGKKSTLYVLPNATIFHAKELLFDKEGIPVSQQHLIYGGIELHDHQTLNECHIAPYSNIHMRLSMHGGGAHTCVHCNASFSTDAHTCGSWTVPSTQRNMPLQWWWPRQQGAQL